MTGEEAKNWIMRLEKFGSKPGLARVEWLLEQLNRPQDELSIIHVAGTNGKGSTCHMMEQILSKHGYRVGLFTSPFVDDFSERIICEDLSISEGHLAKLTNQIKNLSEQRETKGMDHPTQFEVITVLALLYYREVKPDLVILETGLGGRLDATNAIEPVISVITNVGYDHLHVLGNTLEEIASEKAGIIKNNTPVVTGVTERNSAALQVIADRCKETNSGLTILGRDFQVYKSKIEDNKISDYTKTGQGHRNTFDYSGLDMDLQELQLSMIGPVQIQNAALTLCTLELLQKMQIISLEEVRIRQGLLKVYLPVRIEYWSDYNQSKLSCNSRLEPRKINADIKYPDFIFDASHNPEGVCSLMRGINELREKQNWNKIIYVIGMLADKPIQQSLDNITVIPHEFIVTTPENSRALSPKLLSDYLLKRFPDCEVTVSEDLSDAISAGITRGILSKKQIAQGSNWDSGDKNLVVFWGSFYLAVVARQKVYGFIK